jgi:hypothetical protein
VPSGATPHAVYLVPELAQRLVKAHVEGSAHRHFLTKAVQAVPMLADKLSHGLFHTRAGRP